MGSSDDGPVLLEARDEGVLQLTFAAARRLLALAADSDVRTAMLAEGVEQTVLRASEDHRDGLDAARERREPVFRGI